MQNSFQETPFQQWRRAFPWLHLFRVPGIASRFQILIAGFLAGVVPLLFYVFEGVVARRYASGKILVENSKDGFWQRILNPFETFFYTGDSPVFALRQFVHNIGSMFDFSSNNSVPLLVSFFSFVNTLFWGLVISRIVASEFTQGKGIRLDHSIRFAFKKIITSCLSLLFPVLLLMLLLLAVSGIFALAYLPWGGETLSASCSILAITLGFFVSMLGFGIVFGWPAIVAVISTENSDSFDAWSRSYDYIRSRFIPILLAFFLTFFVGTVIYGLLIELTQLTFQWLGELQTFMTGKNFFSVTSVSGLFSFPDLSGRILWTTLLQGYLTAYFWATVTAIYVIVRYSVDQTPINEFKN